MPSHSRQPARCEAGTLYALFGSFDSLPADSVCRRHGYQLDTATNRYDFTLQLRSFYRYWRR